jgi:hypothetical protein
VRKAVLVIAFFLVVGSAYVVFERIRDPGPAAVTSSVPADGTGKGSQGEPVPVGEMVRVGAQTVRVTGATAHRHDGPGSIVSVFYEYYGPVLPTSTLEWFGTGSVVPWGPWDTAFGGPVFHVEDGTVAFHTTEGMATEGFLLWTADGFEPIWIGPVVPVADAPA